MSEYQSNVEKVGRYYDEKGPHWSIVWGDNLHVGYWESPTDDTPLHEAQERLTQIMIEHMPVGPEQRVLDVGCGPGGPGVRLAAETGCEVVGITLSQYQVEKAMALAQARGVADRAKFQYADAMNMPFEDASFDAAWAFESLFYMDHAKAWQEIYRVLRPGGFLVFTDIFRMPPPPGFDPSNAAPPDAEMIEVFGDVFSFLPRSHYEDLLKEIGFEIEKVLDFSANQAETIQRSLPLIQQNLDEFDEAYGQGFGEVVERAWTKFAQVYHFSFGYLLAVVRKPE
ncbi:MAG: methyltransferase domain-containing protein [Anaerolineae bacterium]|nr:methyltransferase domain-containing protein [Anaerolineae bacterium]